MRVPTKGDFLHEEDIDGQYSSLSLSQIPLLLEFIVVDDSAESSRCV